MKRITNYLIAMALMAFTFTSCEDVPSPFGQILPPGGGDEVETFTPEGSGTQADPFNVQGVLEYVTGLGADVQSDKDVYIKGYITAVKEQYSAQYGNAQFTISDSKEGGNTFTFYRGLYLGNKKWEEGNATISEGDEVIICGKVVNYKGTTPETVQNAAYLYSLNGKTEGGGGGDTPTPPGDAKGTGTQADPFNAAAANKYITALAADTESEQEIYIKGKLVKYASNGEFNAQYGNASFYISDDGTEGSEQFYVFRTLYLGNVKYTEGATPKVGDEIVICGKVVNYKGNTPETVANKSYIYTWEGNTSGGGGTPSGGNDGSLDKPFTPAEANALIATLTADTNTDKDYYIKGKLVKYANNGEFGTQYGNATFYLSADGTENGEQFYVFRTLYLGNVKYSDDSWAKPKAGDEIIICGKLVNYKGNTPETVANQSYIYSLNGNTGGGGESGGGSSAEAGTQAKPFTPAEANTFIATLAADTNTDKDYYIKGKLVKYANNGEFGTQYGNATFYLSADGTENGEQFYVFRTLYLGNVKYSDDSWAKPKAGDEIIICGKLVNYKGNTPETVANQSYIYSLNGKTE